MSADTPEPSSAAGQRVAAPPAERPLLVFDGDCGFCRHWIERWRHKTGDRVDYAPADEVADRFPEIPREQFDQSVVLIEPDGRVTTAAQAVFRAYGQAFAGRWLLFLYDRLPGFAPVAEAAYRVVARRRAVFSRLTRWLWGRSPERPQWYLARGLFLRLLAVSYFCAFVSLWVQIDGLYGSNGIHPVQPYLDALGKRLGESPFLRWPTYFWFDASDAALHGVCAAGTIASLALLVGVLPIPALIVQWFCYLSVLNIGKTFLSFQWDILLVETGLVAIFLAPGAILPRPSRERPPVRPVLWLHWWLAFRLMFSAGYVKWAASTPHWRDLTAMTQHYQTQPLPNPIAWYAHQLPEWFHKLEVVGTLAIELVVPFLIIAPRRLRHAGALAMIALMVTIIFTGNYNFFNLLAIAICCLLLDDQFLRKLLRPRLFRTPAAERPPMGLPRRIGRATAATAAIVVILPISAMWLYLTADLAPPETRQAIFKSTAFQRLYPYHIASRYGLFADMTMSRPEIIVEGSNDLKTWQSYTFRYKPDDLDQPPLFVMPHQPRVDWQMWFAALSSFHGQRWFHSFLLHLLEGTPEVVDIMYMTPFGDTPPKYIRARMYDYEFTTPAEKRETGNWWKRTNERPYGPVLTLRDGRLTAIREQ